jgi:hypothetical protein
MGGSGGSAACHAHELFYCRDLRRKIRDRLQAYVDLIDCAGLTWFL